MPGIRYWITSLFVLTTAMATGHADHLDQNCANQCLQDCGLCEPGSGKPACVRMCKLENQWCRDSCMVPDPPPICTPEHDVVQSDAMPMIGSNLGGLSVNVLAGPRDCGASRVSRTVITTMGPGSCSVVDDGDIFWANQLCARDPDMVVGNSYLTAACQELFAGGSDLGDRDCRYIVHAGTPFGSDGSPTCQPSHVVRVPPACH